MGPKPGGRQRKGRGRKGGQKKQTQQRNPHALLQGAGAGRVATRVAGGGVRLPAIAPAPPGPQNPVRWRQAPPNPAR
jgi:hypothetical protein